MNFGDNVRIEMFDEIGDSIFGVIRQTMVEYKSLNNDNIALL